MAAVVSVMFFFAGQPTVDKSVTVTGAGSNTITANVSTADSCRPGYTGSVWVGIKGNSAVQSSVDIC